MPSKLDTDSTDASVGLNYNSQELIETNSKSNATDDDVGINDNTQEPERTNTNEVHNHQHETKPAKIHILPLNPDDNSMLTRDRNSRSSEIVTPY